MAENTAPVGGKEGGKASFVSTHRNVLLTVVGILVLIVGAAAYQRIRIHAPNNTTALGSPLDEPNPLGALNKQGTSAENITSPADPNVTMIDDGKGSQ